MAAAHITQVPDEILLAIYANIPYRVDCLHLTQTCQRLQNIFGNEEYIRNEAVEDRNQALSFSGTMEDAERIYCGHIWAPDGTVLSATIRKCPDLEKVRSVIDTPTSISEEHVWLEGQWTH